MVTMPVCRCRENVESPSCPYPHNAITEREAQIAMLREEAEFAFQAKYGECVITFVHSEKEQAEAEYVAKYLEAA
jgi:hypothetical protein